VKTAGWSSTSTAALLNGPTVYGRLCEMFRKGGRPVQLRPVPLLARQAPARQPGPVDAVVEPRRPVLKGIIRGCTTRTALRVFGAPARTSWGRSTSSPGQGDPAHGRAPGQDRGQAGGQRRRPACITRPRNRDYSSRTPSASCWSKTRYEVAAGPAWKPAKGGQPLSGAGPGLWQRIVPDRRTSTCWTGIATGSWQMTRRRTRIACTRRSRTSGD